MEKRLLLALFLSILVLVGGNFMFPHPPIDETSMPSDESGSVDTSEAGKPEEREPSEPAALAASEPETLEMIVGELGEPGHYRATFSNRGARLRDLQFGGFYTSVGLSDEEKARIARMYEEAKELSRSGCSAEAIDLYRDLLQLDPQHLRARNNLGCLLGARGDHEMALREYQQALEQKAP